MCNQNQAGGYVQQQQAQQLQQHNNSPTCYPHPSGNNANSTSQNWPLPNGGSGTYDQHIKRS